jgi:hypothetical protein
MGFFSLSSTATFRLSVRPRAIACALLATALTTSITTPAQAAGSVDTSKAGARVAALALAAPLPGWVHKDGQYFTYWLPNNDWQAVETSHALDITSPTGLYDVSFGSAETVMPTTTQQIFQTIIAGHAQDMTKWKSLQTSPVTQTPLGTRQVIEFTAMHRYPLQGWQPIRGIAIADALSPGIGYGLDATIMYAPTKSWSKQYATLDRIRTNITPMHS